MNKTKSFTQYTDKKFSIRLRIDYTGKILYSSQIYYNGFLRQEKEKEYRNKNKIHVNNISKIYRLNNKNKIKERQQKWRDNNIKYRKQTNKEWIKNNKDKVRINSLHTRHKRRGWGIIKPLNKWFKGSHFHHLHINNHQEGIFIPENIHKSIYHKYNNKKLMKQINDIAFKWLYINQLT